MIPKRHITSLARPRARATTRWSAAWSARRATWPGEQGLAERGFRLVFNCGDDAGYSVYHIHLHLVGGRKLGLAPG